MPHDAWRGRLEDILEAAKMITQHVGGLDRVAFEADATRRDAVLYRLVIIGEAAAHVPAEIVARYPSVPWAAARAMRNVIVHHYSAVVPEVVWNTVIDDVPRIVEAVADILAATAEP